MEWLKKLITFHLCLQLVLNFHYAFANKTDNGGCADQVDCVKCGPSGTGCMKCLNLMVHATRQCVNVCPTGHTIRWSRLTGQVCYSTGYLWGLSGETFAIITGIGLGVICCFFIIIGGLIYLKYRKKNATPMPRFTEDPPERRDFLKQLEIFRPHAYTFLDMLNDTRRQIRELHRRGEHNEVAMYRPVVRDLAKILLLLNRPPEQIPEIPADWDRLVVWSEKLLKRYKRISDTNASQVAQLINFLQAPQFAPGATSSSSPSSRTAEPQSQFTTLSTFKPDQSVRGSNLSLQDAAIHHFNSTYSNQMISGDSTLNPSWEFPNYSLVTMGTVNWNRSREYLTSNGNHSWIEDEFLQLGYRPQDEITTEL